MDTTTQAYIYYSATTRGFYTESDAQPDCVAVTEDQYNALFEAQSTGKIIVPDANGFPVAQDPPPPTADEILAMNTNQQTYLLQQASSALAPLQMAVTLGMATDDETAQAKAWVTYTRALKPSISRSFRPPGPRCR